MTWLRLLLFSVPVPVSVIVATFIAAGLWGSLEYRSGIKEGALQERKAWERRVADLQEAMESEKRKAEAQLSKMAENAVLRARERDEARETARIANAALIAELSRDPEPETITCEKANETIQCPRCRSCLRQRVDPRILRNLATGRGQN